MWLPAWIRCIARHFQILPVGQACILPVGQESVSVLSGQFVQPGIGNEVGRVAVIVRFGVPVACKGFQTQVEFFRAEVPVRKGYPVCLWGLRHS